MTKSETAPATAAFGARQAMPLESFLAETHTLPLDEMMERVRGTLPGVSRAAHDFARDREQVAALAKRLFDPEWRPLVEWLCDITLRRPLFLPGLGVEALVYAAHREGQNAAVWQLLRAMAEGRSEEPPAREGL